MSCTFCSKGAQGALINADRTDRHIQWPICGRCLPKLQPFLPSAIYLKPKYLRMPALEPSSGRDHLQLSESAAHHPAKRMIRNPMGKRPKVAVGAKEPWKPRPKPGLTRKMVHKDIYSLLRGPRTPYGIPKDPELPDGPIITILVTTRGRKRSYERAQVRAAFNQDIALEALRKDRAVKWERPCRCEWLEEHGVLKVNTSGCPRHFKLKF